MSWAAVEGADRYRVYAGTSSGGQNRYMETSGPATSLAYTGVGEIWEGPPRGGTLWNVKNLLEFKNAQRVKVDGNVFEHMWPASQSGPISAIRSDANCAASSSTWKRQWKSG